MRINKSKFRSGLRGLCVAVGVLVGSEGVRAPVLAQGDLLVSPTRIVFDGRDRAAEVTLMNRGRAPAVYRISFEHLRMTDTGGLEEFHTTEGFNEMFADNFIRYSPRQVKLEPGESQTVRLLVRKPRDLQLGEYRSHLLFRAVPPETLGTDIEALDIKEGEISVRLIPIFGVSIPVIVRHGDLSASAAISDVRFEGGVGSGETPSVAFRIERSGSRSLFGNLTVTFTPDGGRGGVEVGLLNGVAVYPEISSRTVHIALTAPKGMEFARGRFSVTYRESESDGGRLLAEAEKRVP